jgi:hypothetical protein
MPRGREVPLTQEELGHLLGKSRQSIAKLLRGWEQEGMIQTKYGRVFIEQPQQLIRIAYPERAVPGMPGGPAAARNLSIAVTPQDADMPRPGARQTKEHQ